MTTITFTVPGPPIAKGRPIASTFGGRVRMRTPDKTLRYEAQVAIFAQQAMAAAGHAPVAGPVFVQATAVFPVPASWSKRKQAAALAGEVYPTGRPDADNIGKSLDGANGIVWLDDAQIVDLRVRKRYGAVPQLHVSVTWTLP